MNTWHLSPPVALPPASPQENLKPTDVQQENKTPTKDRVQAVLPTSIAKDLLVNAGTLLRQHFWPIVIIYAVKDGLSFLLHRLSMRSTNAGG
jgi:hypothetical protein